MSTGQGSVSSVSDLVCFGGSLSKPARAILWVCFWDVGLGVPFGSECVCPAGPGRKLF